LNWNTGNDATCNAEWANKYLKNDEPPATDNPAIIRQFADYDSGRNRRRKEIANRTLDQWIKPEVQSTPGGVSVFVSKIDFRRAVLCGSASKATDACTENPSSSVVNIPMGDSRFKSVFEEMFSNPTKDLMKYKYPYQGR